MENTLPLKVIALILIIFILGPTFALTYSPYYTHPDLTSQIAELHNYKNETEIFHLTNADLANLRRGAIEEDEPPRWINHFFDPVHNAAWNGNHAGTLAPKQTVEEAVDMAPWPPLPSPVWANRQEVQTLYREFGNQTWQKAINDFLSGDRTSAMVALGHILHLIEDASVPDHTRNDTHSHLHGDPGSPYEDFSENFTNTTKLNLAWNLKESNLPVYSNLTAAFNDVAKYSNANFFSEDTIFADFEKPALNNVAHINGFVYDKINDIYLAKYFENGHDIFYTTNEKTYVLPSYQKHLFSKAVTTGVGVVELFFREVVKYAYEPENLVPTQKNRSLSWIYEIFVTPTGFFKQVGVSFYQNTIEKNVSDAIIAETTRDKLAASKELLGSELLLPAPYFPTLFKPSTGTISIAKSSDVNTLTFGAVENRNANYNVSTNDISLPFVTNTTAIGAISTYVLPNTTDTPGTAGYSTTLYAMAPAVLGGTLDVGEKNILAEALRGIGVDPNPVNAAATAMLLTTALAGLGYVIKSRTENGVAVFDIVKNVPRTVYEQVVNSTNVLTPVTRQVTEYVTVPVSEWYTKPVQILKSVVDTAYVWVQEAVPVIKQVARTVYDYVTSWIPQSVQSFFGGVWQTVTNWVQKVVPVAKVIYDTVVETAYNWVKKPVEVVKQVMQTVYETGVRLIEKTVPIVRDVVEYVSTPVTSAYQRARTVYDEVVVGTVSAQEMASVASQTAVVDEPIVPANTGTRVPPNIFRNPGNGQYWMLTGGLSSFPNGGGGVARFIADQSRVKEVFGDAKIYDRWFGEGSSGWDPRYGGGTSGGAMTLDAMWRQLPEVFTLGTANQSIDAYAKGIPGTGHQMGWVWKPVEMIDPKTNIIYSVDFTEDVNFQDRLGWRRTDTGLYTAEQLRNAVRSYEAYDKIDNFLAHKPYNGNLATPATGTGQPTAFQLYFQEQLALGRTAEDILANNPYMVGGTLYAAPTNVTLNNYAYFDVPFKAGLTGSQMDSIQHMLRTRVNQGWGLNETDAKNFAFAIGVQNWQQFVNLSPNEALALSRPISAWNIGAQTAI